MGEYQNNQVDIHKVYSLFIAHSLAFQALMTPTQDLVCIHYSVRKHGMDIGGGGGGGGVVLLFCLFVCLFWGEGFWLINN